MKKILAIILTLVMLLSLCSCGASNDKASTDQISNNTIHFTLPDQEVQVTGNSKETDPAGEDSSSIIDFTIPDVDIDIDGVEVDTDSSFDFTIPDIDIDIGGIEVNTDHSFDFEIPSLDFDFNISPVEVKVGGFAFEFPDYQFSFDVDTFDVDTFVETSSENFSEDLIDKIPEMKVEDVVLIAETRANLLADLSHAFETSGLSVIVDEELGEIILDSSVLFEVDKAEISAEGKVFLQKFLAVYTAVVYNPKYEGFLSHVLVEGHTDSDGNYDYNLTLSQNRADSVLAFCLSPESGAGAYAAQLESSLEAVGYSYDRLIYDENGNEDKAASRRVSFRFLIALP